MQTNIQNSLPESIKVLYPFDSHFLSLPSGDRLHYVDEGGESPEAVLMIHGNPSWSFLYRDLILELSVSFRCIAPDHLGCGLSDKPQKAPYRLEWHIAHVAHLVESLKLEKIHLVVHDWGGAIGMGLARQMPDKIASITVFNTAAFLSKSIPMRIDLCRLPLIGEVLIRGFNAFAGSAVHMAVEKPLSEAAKSGFLYPYQNWQDRIATHRFVRDIPLRPRHPSFNTLKAIDESLERFKEIPMKICWGAKDWCFHLGFLEEWKRRFPAADVSVYEEAGHYLLEDAGASIIPEVTAFLDAQR